MNRAELIHVGTALYGNKWMGELARDLNVPYKALWHIIKSGHAITPDIPAKLRVVCERRYSKLGVILYKLGQEQSDRFMLAKDQIAFDKWQQTYAIEAAYTEAIESAYSKQSDVSQPTLRSDIAPEMVSTQPRSYSAKPPLSPELAAWEADNAGVFNRAQSAPVGQETDAVDGDNDEDRAAIRRWREENGYDAKKRLD